MTTPQVTPTEPKKKNCLLWGCLITLVLFCLVFACIVSVIGLSFAGIDPLDLDLEDQFGEFSPWQDYYEEPSDDSYYEEKDYSTEEDSEEPSIDFGAESGLIQLAPYQSDLFTFNFFYPEDWDIVESEYGEGVTFFDTSSSTTLTVSKDWLCNGCSTAADASDNYLDVILMESQMDSFEIVDIMPYYLPAGDDAQYGAYHWLDMDGNFQWAYTVIIASSEDMVSFILRGDNISYSEQYGDLIDKVADSFSWK